MKIVKNIDEQFTSPENLDVHYNKHVLATQEFGKSNKISKEEYEALADELSRKPIDHKNILGYISMGKSGRHAYVKYNRDTGHFVVYTYRANEPYTITFYTKTWSEFCGERAIEYFDEIPVGL